MKKFFNFKHFTSKTSNIVIGISSLTLVSGLAISIPLGIYSYNRSYYQKLNEEIQTLSLEQEQNPFKNGLAGLFDNLTVKDNFKNLTAFTALNLAKSKIYNFDLLSLIDLDKLYQNEFQISYDLINAQVSGNSIKNIVLFLKSKNDNQIFSKAVDIKNFAEENKVADDFSKFEIDEKKSSINIDSKNLISFAEFKTKIQASFSAAQATESQKFITFEKALLALKGSYNFINNLGNPSFIRSGLTLEPTIVDNNLSFFSENGKNYLNFELIDGDKKTPIQLEIKGIATNQEIETEIKSWLNDELIPEIKLKSQVQQDLVSKNLSLGSYLYSIQDDKENSSLPKNFSELFNYTSNEFNVNTNKLKNYIVNIDVILKDLSEISEQDRLNLIKDGKVRLNLSGSLTKRDHQKFIKVLDFKLDTDIKPDLNEFSRIFARNLPQTQLQDFSLPKASNTPALSSDRLVQIFNEIKELSSKQIDTKNPDEKLVSQLYLLDFGKNPTKDSLEKYKNELIEIAESSKSQAVQVQTFSDSDAAKNENESLTLGKSIWKALNLQHNFISLDVKPEINFEKQSDNFVIEFSLISTKNNEKLASSKIQINNVLSSQQSAFDVASKFYPTFFIDGKASFSKTSATESLKIQDLSDNDINFQNSNSIENKLTHNGFEIKKAFKFIDNSPKTENTSSSTEMPKTNPAPFSRVNSGVVYFAFRPKNINDYKKHYLLSDSNGSGLFIQKVARSKYVEKSKPVKAKIENKNVEIIPNSSADISKIDAKIDEYVIGFDFKQVENFQSSNTYLRKDQDSLHLEIDTFLTSLKEKQAVVLGPNSWNIKNRFFSADINENPTGFPPNSEYRPSIEIANRIDESRFFSQELRNSSPFIGQKINPIIEQDQDILLEIIKTPWSFEITAYSSSNNQLNSPSSVSLNAKTIYNTNHLTGVWTPFPNFFNLDWAQIGPNPEKMPTDTNSNGSASTQSEKSNAFIILKGLAVYNNSQLTSPLGKPAREEIKRSFINAYLR
ncbi:P110/LppT family adhesin N-terminal domain [Mesomycoplasma ovipneumoniae]|uniref:P110/LppT family adhesin N-terminal domain n=1 Tax=Mesomycoplasma ovipneumoniae TaxID=29562 RepID=A0AAJ2P6N1_9BACT|nr:P110/LppT family adhesin N-terminal domain [Mesomycoplasma ovipneumoniae]MDW2835845.1 P110/LppT family adhesin N-terminal domain [Mesomycoplasma ovipneumoniae]MDW2892081.1 P110/LppT family adhesin N-terminal domain [Mesomycoplasma ovipneumoniae]MDW2893015.1 P110/LppT family adhesin N-terminal domain [Mesomycoplasma ovipneumoniae]MDW2898404.1 P110/LppT family adhesin N-terminal domain [Mesomycoplasma ovipneumoniae]MDW2908751.1 P110/LppT family adhesin N-terminal domain [Mesomycoplasma ovipne